ncbi:MAG: oligosaccharide flippase family protein [Planctomycetales bacterium]|nr:oligosaccharide flippase family protein [Planctomycetales bacterium]
MSLSEITADAGVEATYIPSADFPTESIRHVATECPAATDADAAEVISEPVGTDSLSTSVLLLGGMTVAQKAIGLARNIAFCGLLLDTELGRWSLANSFLGLAAPLVMAGLPGTFGRYVEHYRAKGQLRQFLLSTSVACAVISALCVILLYVFPSSCAWLVFGDSRKTELVRLTALALAAVVAFNFLAELFIALRQARLVSITQFVNSLVFAVVGVALLAGTSLREEALIHAFLVANVVSFLVGCHGARESWRSLPSDSRRLGQRELWSKMVPFTGWIWASTLLINLFETADRFMLVHLTPGRFGSADALVGQYHCSRVVPLMIVGLACMFATVIVPYLSHDWEQGRRDVVSRRLNLSMKMMSLGLTWGSAVVLAGAPLLFGWVLHGKYDAGLDALPLTLTYCTWFSIGCVTQTYLSCAERTSLISVAYLLGLAANIVLNFVLIPTLGLSGAVTATAVSNLIALVLIQLYNIRLGMQVDRGVWIAMVVPMLICLGTLPALMGSMIVAVLAFRGRWYFSPDERRLLWDGVRGPYERVRGRLRVFGV